MILIYLDIIDYCSYSSYFVLSIYFLLLNILGCALMCTFSKDPIFVLFQFLCIFMFVVFLLFFFNIEFLAFVFLLVYLGAVMIFFLFIINFINLRYEAQFLTIIEKRKLLFWEIFNFIILINFCLLYYLTFIIELKYNFLKFPWKGGITIYDLFLEDSYKFLIFKTIASEENILMLLNLYNIHFFLLILLSIIMFIVLVGSIFICEIGRSTKLKNFIIRH